MNKKKNKNSFSYYAKILLAVSLTFLVYGLILDINNDKRLFDPVKDIVVVNEDSGSVTSVDINNSSDDSLIDETKGTKKSESSHDSNDHKSETVDESSDNVSQNSNNSQNQNKNSQIKVQTLDDSNNSLRNSIQNTYGITVKYGSETNGYSVGGLSTVSIDNSTTVNASLTKLNNTLSLFPQGLFKEINDGGIPLTIYLINSYSDSSVTGATDSNYSFANMSIAVSYPFEETLFHESYHYIERYIFKKGLTFNSVTWNNFNPVGFVYGNINNEYSYKNTFVENSNFVNNYAQTSAEEDRASTFEYMMAPSKASCLNYGNPVWQKAKLMSTTMEAALNSVSPSFVEYWERYL